MKKMLLMFALLFMVGRAEAQKFTATVNNNNPAVGENIQITYSLQNAQGSEFKAPSFKGFTLLGGPSTSQNMQMMNGSVSRSITWTYVLRADIEGSYTLASATVKADGKTVQSNSITIKVSKGSAQQQQQQQQQKTQDKDLNKQASDIIKKNLFVTLSVNKTNVYQGEQLVATYKLYLNPELQTRSINPKSAPTFNGFWAQELEQKKIEWSRENVNGTNYNVAVVKRVVLIPQQSGKLTIEPFDFDCVVALQVQNQQRRRNSFFDDFFFNSGSYKDFPFVAKSKTEYVNVKPLPSGAPADFNSAVGEMELKAWLDKPKTKTGEPVTLKVRVSGSGNIKLIEPFKLNIPPDFDAYDPKVSDNVTVSASGVNGSKVFEYLLIPRNPGEFKLDPVHFTYYDLNKKKYITLTSESFTIKVEKGEGVASATGNGVTKEDIKYIGKDIRFIKTTANMNRSGGQFFGNGLFLLLNILPLTSFIFLFFYFRKRRELEGNQVLLRTKRATKVARQRLANAKKFMNNANPDHFYEELAKGLWGYLSDKLQIQLSDLTKDSASASLIQKNISEDLIITCMTAIDRCEFARYAPSAPGLSQEEIYTTAADVIAKLEGALK